MAVRNVITRGFGPGATIGFVVTRGYSQGAEPEPEPTPTTAVDVFAPDDPRRRKPPERDWREIAERRDELRRQIEALFDRPQPDAPPPVAEPAVAVAAGQARQAYERAERAIDAGAVERAAAALQAVAEAMARAHEAARRAQEEDDDMLLLLVI